MKRIILLLCGFVCLAACDENENENIIAEFFFDNSESKQQNTDNQLSKGLVAFYPFDGNTRDISGNSLNGYVVGSIYEDNGHNKESRCSSFPGDIDSYIYVPYSEKLNLNEWTINFWFYHEYTSYVERTMIQMGRENVPGTFAIDINGAYIIDSKGVSYSCSIYEDKKEMPSAKMWHMLSFQVKGTHVALYLDGKWMNGGYLNNEYKNEVTHNLYFGVDCWFGTLSHAFEGYIDDVRIYKRFLSESEIKLLYSK